MDNVLVEVYVPALGQTFDIFIPLELPMHQVLELIKKVVTEISGGHFKADQNTAICYHDDGNLININLSVWQLQIQNGTRLMLI